MKNENHPVPTIRGERDDGRLIPVGAKSNGIEHHHQAWPVVLIRLGLPASPRHAEQLCGALLARGWHSRRHEEQEHLIQLFVVTAMTVY